jgi:hypothetical protein
MIEIAGFPRIEMDLARRRSPPRPAHHGPHRCMENRRGAVAPVAGPGCQHIGRVQLLPGARTTSPGCQARQPWR